MKRFKNVFIPLFLACCFLFSCTKDQTTKPTPPATAEVIIQIDYVGAGGSYHDNITPDSVIYSVGIKNGPYTVDATKTYTIQYQADNTFPMLTKTWTPTAGPWTVHCYVTGNMEYISIVPGN